MAPSDVVCPDYGLATKSNSNGNMRSIADKRDHSNRRRIVMILPLSCMVLKNGMKAATHRTNTSILPFSTYNNTDQ